MQGFVGGGYGPARALGEFFDGISAIVVTLYERSLFFGQFVEATLSMFEANFEFRPKLLATLREFFRQTPLE